jgi:hypothetical protein
MPTSRGRRCVPCAPGISPIHFETDLRARDAQRAAPSAISKLPPSALP